MPYRVLPGAQNESLPLLNSGVLRKAKFGANAVNLTHYSLQKAGGLRNARLREQLSTQSHGKFESRAASLEEPRTQQRPDERILQEPEAGLQSVPEQFVWKKNWYPVAALETFWKDKPNPTALLNEDMVIWYDKDGNWNAAVDECPHKLAPLSEGRIDNGTLECRYHAWQFAADGSCLYNPQSGERKGEGGLNNPKTCLKIFPTKVAQGMLWIWPESGPDAMLESYSKQPQVFDEVMDTKEWMGANRSFISAETDVNWALMVENSMDPSHAPSLHENFLGPRSDMAPMKMKRKDIHPTEGFTVTHTGYTNKQINQKMEAERQFIPPHTVRTAYKMGNGFQMNAVLYFVPSKPGHSRTLAKFITKFPPSSPGANGALQKLKMVPKMLPMLPKLLAMLPKQALKLLIPGSAIDHSNTHALQDQDQLMMHYSERRLAKDSDRSTRPLDFRRYNLASQADLGVASFWQWVDKFGGGDVGWAHGATSADMGPRLERPEIFNHYSRHTKHCAICQRAVERIQFLQKAFLGAVGLIAALTVILSPPLSFRIVSTAAVSILILLRQQLEGLRKSFFSADKLPDEQ